MNEYSMYSTRFGESLVNKSYAFDVNDSWNQANGRSRREPNKSPISLFAISWLVNGKVDETDLYFKYDSQAMNWSGTKSPQEVSGVEKDVVEEGAGQRSESVQCNEGKSVVRSYGGMTNEEVRWKFVDVENYVERLWKLLYKKEVPNILPRTVLMAGDGELFSGCFQYG